MSDWTSGYVADIGYTFGYYQELNPLRVRLAFLNAGLVAPEVGAACELGFGQGMSANLHSAATVTSWHGTDFNPSQAGFAQELASVSGSGARLYDEAFADFSNRSDLPDFDYIGLHGIWSWISDENRRTIVDFIRRKLKVGGVLYISYNTLPGWAAFAPMRHLMTEHAEVIGSEGHGIVSRINGALEFTEKLLATNPTYARANPQIADRIKKIKEQNRHYLAHEYFNRDWHPMHFATMAEWLESAKVQYACSANYLDHVDAINLSGEQQAFLQEIPDSMFRESTRDFMINQQFRKDYWVKGARKLSTLEQAEALRLQKVMLATHRPDVPLKVGGALGEATMDASIYNPILDLLADHRPRTLGQIEQAMRDRNIVFSQILQAVMVLTGSGHLFAVLEDSAITKTRKVCDRLNAYLMNKARGGGDISYLASPVTGGGIAVGRFHQLFLLALSQGKKQPAEWASFVWQLFAMQGQKLVKEGKALDAPEENLTELTAQAAIFAEKHLPIMKALQIA
ncbi:class I SAM-dependent methyltransferase [Denitratisoma oestradiolicum]|uniref:Methyltransferase n=1 Tax=Denitratisoma oestradiolicum TaxID=311182 RepID=A0A6S6Y134_9PROT|nr:class I SAM-dependent methyltransferase [Denitratisoma oestradiolicum]TWO80690.1 methyltransferase [Denitratisoma oestradiolicum]CAB1371013.1 Methyltransferase [Denitratisoma oestradiolicum]